MRMYFLIALLLLPTAASAQMLDLDLSIDDGQNIILGTAQYDLSGAVESDGSVRLSGSADFDSTPASKSIWALDILVVAGGWRWVAPQAPPFGTPIITGTYTVTLPDQTQFPISYTLDMAKMTGSVDLFLQGIDLNQLPNLGNPCWAEIAMNSSSDEIGNITSDGCILIDGQLFANFTGSAGLLEPQDLSGIPDIQTRFGILQDSSLDPKHSDRDGRAWMFNGKPFSIDIQIEEGQGPQIVANGSFEIGALPHSSDWSIEGQIMETSGNYIDLLTLFNLGWPTIAGRMFHSNVPWSQQPNELQGFQTLNIGSLGPIEISIYINCQQQTVLVEYDITNFDRQNFFGPSGSYSLRNSETFSSNAAGSFPGSGDIESAGLAIGVLTGTYFPLDPVPTTSNLPDIHIELDMTSEVIPQTTILQFDGEATEDVENLVILGGFMDLGGQQLVLTGSMLSVPEKGDPNSSRYNITAQLNFDDSLPERGLVLTQFPALAQWLRRRAGINEFPPQAAHVADTHLSMGYALGGWSSAEVDQDDDNETLNIFSTVGGLDWNLLAVLGSKTWLLLTEDESNSAEDDGCIVICTDDPETGEELCMADCELRYAADTQSLPKASPTVEDQLAEFILCVTFSNDDKTVDIIGRYEIVASSSQTANPPLQTRAALRAPQPNPMGSRTSVMLTLPTTSQVEAAIFDLRGRLIRGLFEGSLPVGEHSLHWDGRDATGNSVAAGVYFLKASVGSELFSHKLIVIR